MYKTNAGMRVERACTVPFIPGVYLIVVPNDHRHIGSIYNHIFQHALSPFMMNWAFPRFLKGYWFIYEHTLICRGLLIDNPVFDTDIVLASPCSSAQYNY